MCTPAALCPLNWPKDVCFLIPQAITFINICKHTYTNTYVQTHVYTYMYLCPQMISIYIYICVIDFGIFPRLLT